MSKFLPRLFWSLCWLVVVVLAVMLAADIYVAMVGDLPVAKVPHP